MKNLVLVLVLLIAGAANAQEINWISMDEALAAQKTTPKKIIMDVYTTWCGPCKLLDKKTFGDREVIKYINKNYYAVKFNAEGTEEITYKGFKYTNPNYQPGRKGRNSQHLLASALEITGYPTIYFFNEKGDEISPVVGYKTPAQLEIYLKMIVSDDYKDVNTAEAWQAYQQNFKGTFKG